jgi:tripartite-type tricarboxylate transporter receptor subunit TctC
MFPMKKSAFVAATLSALALTHGHAAAQDFDFTGKQIKIAIGFGVGGTYGQYAQLISEHIEKHIPGNPTAIVDSRPGAGGMRMANYAAKAMTPDGYNYMMPADTAVLVQLMQPTKARYDMSKFTWIGTANQTNVVVVIRTDSGIKRWEDLREEEIPMGTSGRGSVGTIVPKLMNGLLGTKIKVVSGYGGSAKVGLSIEQRETMGAAFNWLFWKSRYEDWFTGDKPEAISLMQVGYFRDPDVPATVPMMKDVVSAADKPLVEFVGALGLIGRGIAAPPGTPKEAIAVMQTAWNKMVKDPAFIADAKKRKLRVVPADAATVQKAVNDAIANANPEMVSRASKMIYGK